VGASVMDHQNCEGFRWKLQVKIIEIFIIHPSLNRCEDNCLHNGFLRRVIIIVPYFPFFLRFLLHNSVCNNVWNIAIIQRYRQNKM
jgi:hypothetical protein